MSTFPPPALFYTYRPAAPLDRFIEQIWYWVGEPLPHAKDRMMPTGTAVLIINLAEDETRSYEGANDDLVQRFPGAVLVGAYSRYSVIDTQEQRANIGVAFRPGGTWPFFDPAAEELHNQHVAMRELWGSSGATLRERILAAPTPLRRLRILEDELLARAVRPLQQRPEIDAAVARLTRSAQEHSIAALSEDVGLSARRFTRLFTLQVGLTPKLYARVQRFQQLLRLMSSTQSPDWSDLAYRCGYFDQSHLIRDCRSLSGFTPSQLRERRSGNSNHVAI